MIDIASMNILIVDEKLNMCRSIRGMLKFLNFSKNTTYAHNGVQAWKIMKNEEIDFVILEWKLPVLTGVELLDKMRDDKGLRYKPVVMISGEANQGIVAEAGESDIDAFLVKPFTAEDLGERMVMVLKKANDPPRVALLLRKSKEAAEEGKVDLSFKLAQAAALEDPKSSKPIRELGVLYFNKRKIENAEKCFVRAVKLNQMDVVALHYLGEIYQIKRNFKVAEKFYRKAMEISPRHVSRAIKFGKVLVEEQMFIKALRIFNAAIKQSGNSYVIKEDVADFCYDHNVNQFALKQYDFLLSRLPSRGDIMKKIGILRRKEGEYSGALNMLRNAEKHAKNDIEIQLEIADVLIIMKQPFRADEILREVIKKDPANERAQHLISMCV